MPSISLREVSVDLPIYNSKGRSLKSSIVSRAVGGKMIDDRDRNITVIRALDQVTLKLDHGSRVAGIGSNGAGKTTLLRVMAGIYPPSSGKVDVDGRAICLTDLSFGMDTEATGLENIRIRGTLFGLGHKEIDKIIPNVAEFTELGEYLKLPIRCYSQGMMLRLGFAISTAIQPDLILLDEIIGAGDAAFAKKAQERLNTMIDRASILVLASHDPTIVARLCTSAIWLAQGSVVEQGAPAEIIERYSASLNPT